jgi:hypothetical protein
MSKEDFNIQDDESCDHDNVCPCCVARESLVTLFIDNLMERVQKNAGKLTIDNLLDASNGLYMDAYELGKNDALEDIIGYAAHRIHENDEDEDIQ